MKCKLHYSDEVRQDLDEIWEYILIDLCNPSAAENVVGRIMDTVEQLIEFPRKGALLSTITGIISDYRFLVSDSYLIFYRVVSNDVYVDRILYERRDYLRILFDSPKRKEDM